MIKLKELRKNKKMTQTDVAHYLNIAQTTYTGYETGKYEPTIATLIKLADLFDVTIDYLVGVSNKFIGNELDQELLSYTNQLNDLEKAKVIGYAKSRVEQQKENKYNELKNRLE